MHDLLAQLSEELRDKLSQKEQPEWMSPMLATLTDDYFSNPDWLFERKLDGERCLAYRKNGKVKLGSRNKKDISAKYPELVEELEDSGADFIADGEIVAFEGKLTSYSRLQARMHVKEATEEKIEKIPVYYYLFDLVYLDGYDLSRLPLRQRKSILKELLSYEGRIRFMAHRNEEGEAFHKEACKKGWEGIIAKKAGGSYVHSRSRDWLKFKCSAQQELVIGGYTEPHGERIKFGAILVGYYEDGELQYAGKVGTGFDDDTLKWLYDKMKKRELEEPPFAEKPSEKEAHWIKPELVAEIAFTEWTGDGKLRHPRYEGLRDDKDPKDVKREKPQNA